MRCLSESAGGAGSRHRTSRTWGAPWCEGCRQGRGGGWQLAVLLRQEREQVRCNPRGGRRGAPPQLLRRRCGCCCCAVPRSSRPAAGTRKAVSGCHRSNLFNATLEMIAMTDQGRQHLESCFLGK